MTSDTLDIILLLRYDLVASPVFLKRNHFGPILKRNHSGPILESSQVFSILSKLYIGGCVYLSK